MTTMKNKLKILILEDNYRLLAEWKKVLEEAGHEVTTAYNTASALRFNDQAFDCFIVDLYRVQDGEFLPDGGIRIIGKIKKEFPHSKDPLIIAVTGYFRDRSDMLSTDEVMRNMGATLTLRKPLDPSAFLKCIDARLENKPNTLAHE